MLMYGKHLVNKANVKLGSSKAWVELCFHRRPTFSFIPILSQKDRSGEVDEASLKIQPQYPQEV